MTILGDKKLIFKSSFFLILAVVHAHIANLYQENISEENIVDEIFHVTQTQTFCTIASDSANLNITSVMKLMYQSYDRKITTPPGPYIFAQLYSQYILQDVHCTIETIRSVNILFNLGTVIVLNEILKLLENKHDIEKPIHYTRLLILILSPVHFFFGFLFYTDAGSTFLILLSYLFALKIDFQNAFISTLYLYLCSIAGFIALWFRQTNIIWYGFIVGTILLRFFDTSNINENDHTDYNNANSDGTNNVFIKFFNQILQYIFYDCIKSKLKWLYCILSIAPFAGVVGSFICFLKWNNYQIVLGDQSHHQPVLHVPQLFYFAIFTLVPTFHVSLLLRKNLVDPMSRGTWHMQNFDWIVDHRYLILNIVVFGLIFGSVLKYTMVHPFMLADNRHYTFYIWNKILKHRSVQLLLTPVYMVIGRIFIARLLERKGVLWAFGFIVCTSLVLIPAHLIEFRYYTIPSFFATIHLLVESNDDNKQQNHKTYNERWYMKWTVLFFIIGNAALIYIFLYRTFIYADGSVGRFMF